MIPSIRGGQLPESLADFEALLTRGALRYTHCIDCRRVFGAINVHSEAGWRETQISGECEECYDQLFADEAQDSGVDQL